MSTPAEDAQAATAALNAALTGPKSFSGDAGTAVQFDLDQMIAADRYLAAKAAAGKATRGLRITRLIPPGTT